MSGIDRKSLIILAEDAANALSTVLVDSSRRLVSVFVGSEGATVKQNATGELVTEIQGSEALAVKQKATTGELITEIQGSEALAIKQKTTTGEMIAEMQGSEGIAIAQETVTGEMIAIFKALYNSSLITVAADANGRLSADFGLYEQATFNMDTYAEGTDNRISYSSTMSMPTIKYWINVQNSLIVIRHIDVQGSASLGTYELAPSTDNVISGSTGINISTVDTKIYRQTISNSEFDYSETNCLFKGFIADYSKNNDDLSIGYAVVTGGVNAPNAYDDDLTTTADYSDSSGNPVIVWEISLSEININDYHLLMSVKSSNAAWSGLFYFDIEIDGVWTNKISDSENSTSYQLYSYNIIDPVNKVTGLRIRIRQGGGYSVDIKIHDVSMFV